MMRNNFLNYRLQSWEVMYSVASISASVSLSIHQSTLSQLNRLTFEKSHYQSKVFVC